MNKKLPVETHFVRTGLNGEIFVVWAAEKQHLYSKNAVPLAQEKLFLAVACSGCFVSVFGVGIRHAFFKLYNDMNAMRLHLPTA